MQKGTQSAKQIQAFVLQRLSATNEPYLLCFDNADDLSLIKDCFPRDNVGTILVTTRNFAGTGEIIGEGVIVPEFSIQEGSQFLGSALQSIDMSDFATRTLLEDISTAFHGYPLALAQAAAFIRNGGCALSDFLDIFQDKRNSNAIASIPVEDYHATLFTVWDLSFQSLSERSRNILEMLVYFDPDSIPYTLLESRKENTDASVAADLGYTTNPVGLWDALKGLRSQSLIRTNAELKTISIHRFLQEQASEHLCLDPRRRCKAFEESLSVLTDHQPVFPNVTQHWSPDLFKNSELCLPHIQKLAGCFMESPSTFSGLENKVGKLIFECASYQFERFHHQAATQSFALAREVIGFSTSPDELCLSDCYRMEGRMFNESGQPTRAAESNRKAQNYALAALSKGYIKKDDQRIPRILTGLGNSLSQLEQFDDALAAQLEAKILCGDVPPDQSDAITIIQLNLGFLLYRRGDLNNAERVLRATLDASPKTAPAMYALGNTLLAKGKVKEAIAVHLGGLRIYIDMFGEQHALVGRCAYKVGEILLLYKADPQTASSSVSRKYIRRAIQIYLKQESPYYTVKAYARASRMLGKAFEIEGRPDEARPHYEKAWDLREQIDGIHGSSQDVDADYASVMFYWDQ
ncbi:hypothetical protein F5883DRAFT_528538 [Diaporthe sp. PMI_573]|nr:hypothetical protein F5883DRAFT_528538 [Diaporthaceae sp. PMI_573]